MINAFFPHLWFAYLHYRILHLSNVTPTFTPASLWLHKMAVGLHVIEIFSCIQKITRASIGRDGQQGSSRLVSIPAIILYPDASKLFWSASPVQALFVTLWFQFWYCFDLLHPVYKHVWITQTEYLLQTSGQTFPLVPAALAVYPSIDSIHLLWISAAICLFFPIPSAFFSILAPAKPNNIFIQIYKTKTTLKNIIHSNLFALIYFHIKSVSNLQNVNRL